jgi:general secretion pathway protein H
MRHAAEQLRSDCRDLPLPARERGPRAFTLLELVLVMVIISTVLAMAAPSLRGWSKGAKLRDAADQVLSLTRLARTQAISTATVYQLNVDSQAGTYFLTQQQARLQSSHGQTFTMPQDTRIELTVSGNNAARNSTSAVEFYPDGRTQPAIIKLTDDAGRIMQIQCASPVENFVMASSSGEGR